MTARHPVSDAELMRVAMEVILSDVHVAVPAEVQKYTKNRATVLPKVRKPLRGEDGGIVYEDFPSIPNVLVVQQKGGVFGMHVPLAPGDHVVLVFSDNSYSEWRQTGNISSPKDLRRHGAGYPFAFPGVVKNAALFGSLGDGGLRLGKDDSDEQIRIDDNGSIDIGVGGAAVAHYAFLKTAMDALKAFCDNARDRGDGNPWTTVSDVAAAAGTLKTALGGSTPTLTTVSSFGTEIGKVK